MMLRIVLYVAVVCWLGIAAGCSEKGSGTTANPSSSASSPSSSKTPGPLPDGGFKAEVSLPEPPAKLRSGQKEMITLKVKNVSNVIWWQRGGETNDRSDNIFYIAAGNHWLDKDGKPTAETEGHSGIPKDLKPGEETEMTLEITAPKTPGDYILSLDMVQEGVAWFADKGSTPTKVKVTVVK